MPVSHADGSTSKARILAETCAFDKQSGITVVYNTFDFSPARTPGRMVFVRDSKWIAPG